VKDTPMKPTLRTTLRFDRQGMKRPDDAYINGLRTASSTRYFIMADTKPVFTSNVDRTAADLRWFTAEQLKAFGLDTKHAIFLGVDRSTGSGQFALAITEAHATTLPGASDVFKPLVDLRSLAMQGVMSAEDISLVNQAKALTHWHESAFCGRCGGATAMKDGGWKRKCTACGQEHFPRTDPVVIMLITDGERCLLGHEARFAKEPRMYSTLAGFIEPGEDLEHAVQREIFEEAGLTVGEVRYHSSQPWGFPHTLMLGAMGFADTTTINIDPTEIEEARWFSKAEAQLMLDRKHPENWWVPGQQAIARALIKAFVDGWWKANVRA
jgi:NAD+ diphosphatase